MKDTFLNRPVIVIHQPLGVFYAFSLNAQVLNRITYSQPAEIRKKMEGEFSESTSYSIFGTQRKESKNRLQEISQFIKSNEAIFPNTIILAANYDDDGILIEDESKKWVIRNENGQDYLRIPITDCPTASIIDGQHRLHAFELLDKNGKRSSNDVLELNWIMS